MSTRGRMQVYGGRVVSRAKYWAVEDENNIVNSIYTFLNPITFFIEHDGECEHDYPAEVVR